MSTDGSCANSASVPFPWWTSKSTTATRSSPSSSCAYRAAMATFAEDAEAHRRRLERVVPRRANQREAAARDGLDRAPGGEASRLPGRRGGVRVGIEPDLARDRLDRVDVARGVHELDLAPRRRLADDVVRKAVVERPEASGMLVVASGLGRVQGREGRMADHVHVSASSNLRATPGAPSSVA